MAPRVSSSSPSRTSSTCRPRPSSTLQWQWTRLQPTPSVPTSGIKTSASDSSARHRNFQPHGDPLGSRACPGAAHGQVLVQRALHPQPGHPQAAARHHRPESPDPGGMVPLCRLPLGLQHGRIRQLQLLFFVGHV